MAKTAKTKAVAILVSYFFATGAAAATEDMMRTGSLTTQPIGHYDLCHRIPAECQQTDISTAPVELTRKLWSRMIEVNNAFNTIVVPRTDQEMWGKAEYWSYPTRQGDCEDFVLAKRRALMDDGLPASSLLITVVRQPNGDGHAVLTVRTHMGDFILDNLEPRILRWHETEYRYLKRQSESNPGAWVQIMDERKDTIVSSVRN